MLQFSRLSLLLGLGMSAFAPALAVAAECDNPDHVWPAALTIKAGLQEVLPLPGTVTRVSVGEPTTADVALVDTRNLLVQARKAGETSLLLWTKCSKEPARIVINVPAAMNAAQQVAQPATAEALTTLPSQVQVDIRFVELSRSRLRELGVRFARNTSNFNFSSNNVNYKEVAKDALDREVPAGFKIPLASDPFNFFWQTSNAKFGAAIDLLEQTGYAYTLANPSLVAMSGQSATFLAGGEVPIPIPQGGNSSTITVEYKEFGVRLAVSPTVLSSSQLILKVSPEVSELDYTNAITLQGSTIPALRVRRTDTSVTLGDNESFVISGLISRNMRDNVDKMPWLGDIPVLGAFFRSKSFNNEDSELVMIVTPKLVKPLAAGAKLPPLPGEAWRNYEPSTTELFWKGARSPYKDTPIGLSR